MIVKEEANEESTAKIKIEEEKTGQVKKEEESFESEATDIECEGMKSSVMSDSCSWITG